MNWNTPMLFFLTNQSYLPADTQNRTDTMMKPSCCTLHRVTSRRAVRPRNHVHIIVT